MNKVGGYGLQIHSNTDSFIVYTHSLCAPIQNPSLKINQKDYIIPPPKPKHE